MLTNELAVEYFISLCNLQHKVKKFWVAFSLSIRYGIYPSNAVDLEGNKLKGIKECESVARRLLEHGVHLNRANYESKEDADVWSEKMEEIRTGLKGGNRDMGSECMGFLDCWGDYFCGDFEKSDELFSRLSERPKLLNKDGARRRLATRIANSYKVSYKDEGLRVNLIELVKKH